MTSDVAGATTARKMGAFEGIRAFGVVLGGSVGLVLGAMASGLALLRDLARIQIPRPWALAGTVATAIYVGLVRPWHLRWGARTGELGESLPGDQLLATEGTQILHAITIDAPADRVWPWVAQLGQDRGGFYSYEWLENLAGCQMRNADRIQPDWQTREPGELLFLHPAGGLKITAFEPGQLLGIENWGNVVIKPDGPDRTRLLVRGRIPTGPFAAAYAALMEIPHFIMERRMLLGIKQRAERTAAVNEPAQGEISG